MPLFKKRSIAKIFNFLVLLALLPALLIIFYSGLELRRNAIENAQREVLFLAKSMAEVQRGVTHAARQTLATLSQLNEIKDKSCITCSTVFLEVIKSNPSYINIAAVDADGDVFASAVPHKGTNLADRLHIRRALSEKKFAVGEYIVTRVGQQLPSLPFAHPVFDRTGNISAVLTAAVGLERFADFFNKVEMPPGAFFAVADHHGIRLFHHPSRGHTNPIGDPIIPAAWEALQRALTPGISIHNGPDGVRRIYAYQPVTLDDATEPYAYMWAGIPEALVLRPANQILARNLVLMFTAAVLAVSISMLMGGTMLLDPIEKLVAVTHSFGRGDLGARANLGKAPDELATLSKSFNEMASALIKGQEELRAIADFTYDWEYWLGADQRLVWMSPSCKRVTGYDISEFMQDPGLIERIVHPLDLESFQRHLSQKGHDTHACHIDLRIVHKAGHTIWINHRCIPIARPDGTRLGLRVSNRDISDRKKIEDRLQQAQKSEAIGALAGGIAHDFNNILTPIIAFSEMLLHDLPAENKHRKHAAEILKAGQRASDLVKQILSFSRQAEHHKMPVRFQQILAEAVKLTRATIPSNIEMHLNIQRDCDPVLADPTNLHQIAMNLITNAYHAVEKDGGSITIDLRQVQFTGNDASGAPLQPGRYALLSVTDTGHGIPGHLLAKIFDPYFTTKPHGKGTGLGLSVVYGIVKDHGGDIRVYSEAGQGTTFKIYLPIPHRIDVTDTPAPPVEHATGTERILLVDDEKMIVEVQRLTLERLGYRVTAFTSSSDALQELEANAGAYDLVITDMAMPVVTGEQLARHLETLRPDLPVILCTGFSERIAHAKVNSPGIKGILMKPLTISDLAASVRQVLDEEPVKRV
ncbi:hybrid sensor histidine kinase/response regulator [Desulfatitalea tepidiphila]|uniref:hybrid sensor histidine kinase/response regulator n=1 Tax=Desulfatitalea tepidiphila TaxID=1185843 RepID=UPI0006B5E5AD|nr:ATP-binding protein [Desulfatitalea tepidiphila]